jgi:hypothetical protein
MSAPRVRRIPGRWWKNTPRKSRRGHRDGGRGYQEIAELYAKAEVASIVYCMGITQHTSGVDNVKSLANLAMLTGNIGRASTAG